MFRLFFAFALIFLAGCSAPSAQPNPTSVVVVVTATPLPTVVPTASSGGPKLTRRNNYVNVATQTVDRINKAETLGNAVTARADITQAIADYKAVSVPTEFAKADSLMQSAFERELSAYNLFVSGQQSGNADDTRAAVKPYDEAGELFQQALTEVKRVYTRSG
ncbi:MAG: hypothetical protein EOO38_08260 [Cytophagaceae bacterium]|nr:MAG: hypothetical protein EOO38_08260 [Cytophagaceae bacterium]